MPNIRAVILANNEIYHVYNRSVANESVFNSQKNIKRALDLIDYYKCSNKIRFSFFSKLDEASKSYYLEENNNPLVEIYAYCLMQNHFHLLLKQISENGIEKFVGNFQNAYAKYYNIRRRRFGALFQRPFKSKHVSGDEELLHLSRYIHLNPVTSFLATLEDLKVSNITSLPAYLSKNTNFIANNLILNILKTPEKYLKFLEDQVDYQRKLSKIRHLIIEK